MSDSSFFALNNFDFVIYSIVFLSTLFALIRGFVKCFISLVGWIISLVVGARFCFLLVPIISKYVTSESVAVVGSALILFLITAIILAIINSIFYLALASLCGGFLDRSMGVLFGFIRGCILASAAFYLLLFFMPQLSDENKSRMIHAGAPTPLWAKNSKTIAMLNRGAHLISDCVPKRFGERLKNVLSKEGIERVKGQEGASGVAQSGERVSQILASLPKDVLNLVQPNHLVILQDSLSSPEMKILALKDVMVVYQEYMNEGAASLSGEEINDRDVKYYKTMAMLEEEIAKQIKIEEEHQ